METYNNFCVYCVGGHRKEIRDCKDFDCPFYPFRRGGLEPEVEKDICQKILKETGVLQ